MNKFDDLAICVYECKRQDGSADDVLNLYCALVIVRSMVNREEDPFTVTNITHMFNIASGGKILGFRVGPAVFNQGKAALPARLIGDTLDRLLTMGDELSAYDWTKEFLCIHPGQDYNGRVAWILYNLKNGTINDLVPLPRFEFN